MKLKLAVQTDGSKPRTLIPISRCETDTSMRATLLAGRPSVLSTSHKYTSKGLKAWPDINPGDILEEIADGKKTGGLFRTVNVDRGQQVSGDKPIRFVVIHCVDLDDD